MTAKTVFGGELLLTEDVPLQELLDEIKEEVPADAVDPYFCTEEQWGASRAYIRWYRYETPEEEADREHRNAVAEQLSALIQEQREKAQAYAYLSKHRPDLAAQLEE